jgi:hypothetical protein
VPPVPDQGAVQQLPPAAADLPFHDRIHSRRLDRGADDPDARGLEHCIERQRQTGVPVVQHEPHPAPGIVQVHEQVPGLLHDPGLDRAIESVDTITSSKVTNLKELRPGSRGRSEVRILLVFDPWRSAILLVAGDKAGSWNNWYARMIPRAEQLYEIYLKERAAEEGSR